jgi:hypothetical protein
LREGGSVEREGRAMVTVRRRESASVLLYLGRRRRRGRGRWGARLSRSLKKADAPARPVFFCFVSLSLNKNKNSPQVGKRIRGREARSGGGRGPVVVGVWGKERERGGTVGG